MPSLTITAVVVGIVDIAPYVRRIMTAAVVVGIIAVDRAWTYRQVNSWAARTRSDRNHRTPDVLAGLVIGPPARVGSGHWRNADETHRQQASHQNRGEQNPTAHEIASHSSPSRTVIRDRSKLPPDLGADAEAVFFAALEDVMGNIEAGQSGPVDRDRIASTDPVLRFRSADAEERIAEGLHCGHLEDELLIQIEEILHAYRAAPGVGSGVVELRIAG